MKWLPTQVRTLISRLFQRQYRLAKGTAEQECSYYEPQGFVEWRYGQLYLLCFFRLCKARSVYAKGHADYERYNVRLNYNNVLLDTKSRNWLNKISFGAIASYSKSIQTGNTIGNSEAAGLITSMNMLPPTEPVYQTDPAILEQYAVTYPNHVITPTAWHTISSRCVK